MTTPIYTTPEGWSIDHLKPDHRRGTVDVYAVKTFGQKETPVTHKPTDADAKGHVMTHKLVDGSLVKEGNGIVARCTCGWQSPPHFSSASASVAFREHVAAFRQAADQKEG